MALTAEEEKIIKLIVAQTISQMKLRAAQEADQADNISLRTDVATKMDALKLECTK